MEGSWRGEGGARARVRRGEAKTKKERANGVQSAGRGGQAGEAVRAGRGLEGEAILWDESPGFGLYSR